jgi:hypothetical protein
MVREHCECLTQNTLGRSQLMQDVDEFREPVKARNFLRAIKELAGKSGFVTHRPRWLPVGLRFVSASLQTSLVETRVDGSPWPS